MCLGLLFVRHGVSNWKVTPFHFHSMGRAHVVNEVHAYMSPPPSAVISEALFRRNLSVAYPRLAYPPPRRRSAYHGGWTKPSPGTPVLAPSTPDRFTELISIKKKHSSPNGCLKNPHFFYIKSSGRNSFGRMCATDGFFTLTLRRPCTA